MTILANVYYQYYLYITLENIKNNERKYIMSQYLGPEKCLEKKKKYIMPCLGHFFANPPQFVKGEMQYLYDHEGKKIFRLFCWCICYKLRSLQS